MGVRFLQSFMGRQVQDGVYYVQIPREIRNSAERRKQKPLILIDLMALHHLFSGNKCSVLCGSQVMLCEQQAAQFFSQLVESGAELVFFWDGNVQENKYDTWMTRQNEKYTRMITIIDAINRGQALQRIAKARSNLIPSNTCIQLKLIAERYGRVIVSFHAECDQELAAYALEHETLAIISNDTDFLIFEGCWQLWSADINLETLRTRAFSKEALRRKLQLSVPGMALWATLSGNDFYNYEQLKPFHHTLGSEQGRFLKLAQYVRTLPSVEHFNDDNIQQVLRRVYKGRRIPDEAVAWFKQSLDFYRSDLQTFHRSKPPLDSIETFLLQESQHFILIFVVEAPNLMSSLVHDYVNETELLILNLRIPSLK
ncbi:constitutive coactivator of peroxisome proliferator-activated receptor gamma-like [Anopheles cruzii]|uniref:constitutive coactivator of peroxisome proliferator-activated receptor gamma-like n=1 Tax=Anopheles cruzii TaxID=68878 RepID=UPI0022EC7A7F|nr:constitutive coactivator of peroxisome proliferator-activated receptor gamma-like [Anopheles cruzii]